MFRRIAIFTLLFIGVRCAVSQTYGRLQFQLQNTQGQAISGGQITVYSQPACGSSQNGLATLYPGATGGTPLSQPLVTDGYGAAFAYATVQCYTVQYSSPYTGTQVFIDQVPLSPSSGGGGSGSVGSGSAGQLAVYPSNGTSVSGSNNVSNITIDGATPTNLGSLDTTTSIQTQLNAKAPTASPGFTGSPTLAGATDTCNNTPLQLATEAYVQACSTSGGSGTVNTGTGGNFTYYPSTGTTVDDDPHWSDNGTTLNATEDISVNDGSGAGGGFVGGFGTALSVSSSQAGVWADSGKSREVVENGAAAAEVIPGVYAPGTAGDLWMVDTDTYGIKDSTIPASSVNTKGALVANVKNSYTANVSGTVTVYTTPSSPATARYQVCTESYITTAAGTSSTFPDIIAVFTSGYDSATKNQIVGVGGLATSNGTFTGSSGCMTVSAAASTIIGYKTSSYVSTGSPTMTYYIAQYVYTAN